MGYGRLCSPRALPTHGPSLVTARTPLRTGEDCTESAQGLVAAGACRGRALCVYGPVCVCMFALGPVDVSRTPSLRYACASPCVSQYQLLHPPLRGVLPITIG